MFHMYLKSSIKKRIREGYMPPNKSKTLMSFKALQVEHIKVKKYCEKINLIPCCALEPILNKCLYA
jgi:hypothetical protein